MPIFINILVQIPQKQMLYSVRGIGTRSNEAAINYLQLKEPGKMQRKFANE